MYCPEEPAASDLKMGQMYSPVQSHWSRLYWTESKRNKSKKLFKKNYVFEVNFYNPN